MPADDLVHPLWGWQREVSQPRRSPEGRVRRDVIVVGYAADPSAAVQSAAIQSTATVQSAATDPSAAVQSPATGPSAAVQSNAPERLDSYLQTLQKQLFGAALDGANKNALKCIQPATNKMETYTQLCWLAYPCKMRAAGPDGRPVTPNIDVESGGVAVVAIGLFDERTGRSSCECETYFSRMK